LFYELLKGDIAMSEMYETKSIVGKSVMDTGAMNIGKVKDMVINISDWTVECLLVKIPRQISKELGIGGIMGATARITPEFIDQIGDLVRLNITAQEMAEKIETD